MREEVKDNNWMHHHHQDVENRHHQTKRFQQQFDFMIVYYELQEQCKTICPTLYVV